MVSATVLVPALMKRLMANCATTGHCDRKFCHRQSTTFDPKHADFECCDETEVVVSFLESMPMATMSALRLIGVRQFH